MVSVGAASVAHHSSIELSVVVVIVVAVVPFNAVACIALHIIITTMAVWQKVRACIIVRGGYGIIIRCVCVCVCDRGG